MKVRISWISAICGGLLAARSASAVQLDVNDNNSIIRAASAVAANLVNLYTTGEGQIVSGIPGLLPGPYYWWEAGAMFGSLIDYWYYTNDDRYNNIVTEAILFQVGEDTNFEPSNQTKSLGNDDQAFWALAAMSAAEVAFPNPPLDQPQWLALAQAVFNRQAQRWDTTSCAGGLKWQIFPFNLGYDYKNTISNGCFFNLASRLGAYTHNETYLQWATKSWDWISAPSIALVSNKYQVFDGTNDNQNCSSINHVQWSYNAGVYLLGAANMWNQTEGSEQAIWETRVRGILTAAGVFFKEGTIMYEVACEPSGNCNTDQRSFKAYLARWMAATIKAAPWTHDLILPLLQSSATAAATSCSGGDDGSTCGLRWTSGSWDGQFGVGEQMSGLEVIQSTLIDSVPGPVSQGAGGISKGDPSAGANGQVGIPVERITTSDRAGAGIVTAILLVGLLGGAWWLCT